MGWGWGIYTPILTPYPHPAETRMDTGFSGCGVGMV